MLTLTRETHFIFSGVDLICIKGTDLSTLVQKYRAQPDATLFEKPNYCLSKDGKIILETDDIRLALASYVTHLNQEPRTMDSTPSSETLTCNWIDCIKGQIRITVYFRGQAVQTLARQSPKRWSIVFDCRWDTSPEAQGWPSDLDFSRLEGQTTALIQKIEAMPLPTHQYPIRVPLTL